MIPSLRFTWLLTIVFSLIVLSHAQPMYEPGERRAEELFEQGKGGPWIISEKHPELYGKTSEDDTSQDITITFSQYAEYFSPNAPITSSEVESYPITGHEPSMLFTGGISGPSLAYSTYQSTYGGSNALWIQGSTSWTQYVECPRGSYLRLLAYTSSGGKADFYKIDPGNMWRYKLYSFYPGYNRLTFNPDEVGRHILLFVINNRPSNAVIVDVIDEVWPPLPGPMSASGYASVILRSSSMQGYDVYVDDIYIGTDGQGGDSRDGIYSLTVTGNKYHVIKLSCQDRYYMERGTFLSGYTYRLSI
jgi:hypothetical protein